MKWESSQKYPERACQPPPNRAQRHIWLRRQQLVAGYQGWEQQNLSELSVECVPQYRRPKGAARCDQQAGPRHPLHYDRSWTRQRRKYAGRRAGQMGDPQAVAQWDEQLFLYARHLCGTQGSR